MADLCAGLDHLASAPSIDAERVGAAAVCRGWGYAVHASIGNPRVKALGSVAGQYRDRAAMREKDSGWFDAKVVHPPPPAAGSRKRAFWR